MLRVISIILLLIESMSLITFGQQVGYVVVGEIMALSVFKQEPPYGLYQEKNEVKMDSIPNEAVFFAQSKKHQMVFLENENGIYRISLTKEEFKHIKSMKIPNLKDDAIRDSLYAKTTRMRSYFREINDNRKHFVEDSLAFVERQRREAEEARLQYEKRVQDSLDYEREKIEYFANHDWQILPVESNIVKDDLGGAGYNQNDCFVLGMSNDTVYYVERNYADLGVMYLTIHRGRIPQKELKTNKMLRLHLDAFGDSIANHYIGKDSLDVETIKAVNELSEMEAYGKAIKKAPYGFIREWHWNDEYGAITFYVKYTNTNAKTIKYLDFYFKVTNDVGDVRCTGHLKGTGPLEQFETASWDWDYTRYYTAGDSSNMSITKIIITYMNGSKKILTNNQIQINK